MKKYILTFFAAAVLAFLPACALAYLDKAHRNTAEEMSHVAKKFDRQDSYAEIYYSPYLSAICEGAVNEDYGSAGGNHRAFRHFYDPDASGPAKGLPYHSWYKLWQVKDSLFNKAKDSLGIYYDIYRNTEVTEPAGGYYDNALEWARDSIGTNEVNNWEKAIKVYDYTESSRKAAYKRMGHVLHLLADMAEPDHVYCYPHPGSDRAAKDIVLDLVTNAPVLAWGFERMMDEETYEIAGNDIRREASLDEYFNRLARNSKSELKKSGLTVPLGLKTHVDEVLGIGFVEIAWIPTIDPKDRAAVGKYLLLGRTLLKQAAEFGAGLLYDFHDIVNQPPYLKRIVITQDGELIYEDSWKDLLTNEIIEGSEPKDKYYKVSSRMRDSKKLTGTLKCGKEAKVFLEFGPSEAEPKERIDPSSVGATVGEVNVTGWRKIDERTFEASFIPELKAGEVEKAIPVEVRARDLNNHYPREGLPRDGYELDNEPYSPARVGFSKPPYEWVGYSPGADKNHYVTVRNETPPPFVESITVAGGEKYYLNERWAQKQSSHEAELIQDGKVDSGGVNVAEVPTGTVRITFSREIEEPALKFEFGGQLIQMKKIAEKTYEGLIRFSEFKDKYLNESYVFVINAKDKDGSAIDGDPASVPYIDEELRVWRNFDAAEDLTHRLHVYYDAGDKPIIRGRLRLQKEGGELVMDMKRVYTHGKLLVPGGYMPKESGLAPAPSGYNILWYIQSIEIPDKELFNKYKDLMRTRLAIMNRPQSGPTRIISRQEFKDCLELVALREKIKQSATVKSGSRPGWLTTTDKDGFFDILAEKYPGRDGVIYSLVHAKATPPFGQTTPYFPLEQTSFSNMAYDLSSPGINAVAEDELTPELLKDAPDPDQAVKLRSSFPELERKLRAAEVELENKEKEIKLPDNIEKKWTERANKDQRALEAQYIQKHGPATGWSDEVRKDFEKELYEAPKKSRQSWEKDFNAFMVERSKAIDGLKENVESLGKERREAQSNIERMFRDEVVWKAKLKEKYGDLSLMLLRYGEGGPQFIYQLGGTVSGSQVTIPAESGYTTEAMLIKQTLDEKWKDRPLIGRYTGTGQESVTSNLKDPKDPRPPFVFDFGESLGPHLMLNTLVSNITSPDFVTVHWVRTTAEHIGNPEAYKNIIDQMWDTGVELPGNIEVEGYPIKDQALLDELEAALKKYDEATAKAAKDCYAIALERQSGKLGREEAIVKQNKALMTFAQEVKGIADILNRLKAKNPAFASAVQEEVLGRKMPAVQRTVERRPAMLPENAPVSMPPLPKQMPPIKQIAPPTMMLPPGAKMNEKQIGRLKQDIEKLKVQKKLLLKQKEEALSDTKSNKAMRDMLVQNIDNQIKFIDSQIEMLNQMIQ